MKKIVMAGIWAVVLFLGCSKGDDNPAPPGGGGGGTLDCNTVTAKAFAADVSPIIQTKCATDATCHGSGSTNGPGPLLNYAAISGAKSNIRTAVANGTMPKTGTITAAQKNSILCWIDGGAPNN